MKTTFAPEAFVSNSIADSVRSAATTVKNFLRGKMCITVAVAATVIFLAALFTAANSATTVASGLVALTAIAADTSDDSQPEEEGGES